MRLSLTALWIAVPAMPVAADPPAWEVRAGAAYLTPKTRILDGEPGLRSDSLHVGSDLQADDPVVSPQLELGYRFGDERFSLGGWWVGASGSSALKGPRAFGGQVLAAGTPLSSDLDWASLRLEWRHTFELADWLNVEAGLAGDWTSFDSRIRFPGGSQTTSLDGFYPTPQIGIEIPVLDLIAIRGGAGGFHVAKYSNGDTDVAEPLEYRAALRARLDSFSVELGYYLYHVHLERGHGAVDADEAHIRLRSIYLQLGYAF